MEYISRHPDLELVEIYDEDDGYSGTNMERPGFQRMLQDDDSRNCLLYTSPSPRDTERYRMPSSA